MHKSLIALALVAGCGGGGQAGNQAADQVAHRAAAPVSSEAPAAAGASLTGLYEGGAAHRPDQLCILDKAGKAQFGIVVWGGANLNSCSGAGEAERRGGQLTLRMAGDAACSIEASVESGRIVLRQASGPGCESYYCGHGARFEGAAFTRKGAGAAAAKKATDIAGDPLCG